MNPNEQDVLTEQELEQKRIELELAQTKLELEKLKIQYHDQEEQIDELSLSGKRGRRARRRAKNDAIADDPYLSSTLRWFLFFPPVGVYRMFRHPKYSRYYLFPDQENGGGGSGLFASIVAKIIMSIAGLVASALFWGFTWFLVIAPTINLFR
jgi:hypothetical protein